jgi:hypothetical protein
MQFVYGSFARSRRIEKKFSSRSRVLCFVAVALGGVAALLSGATESVASDRVAMCHQVSDTDAVRATILVELREVLDRLAQGASLGECTAERRLHTNTADVGAPGAGVAVSTEAGHPLAPRTGSSRQPLTVSSRWLRKPNGGAICNIEEQQRSPRLASLSVNRATDVAPGGGCLLDADCADGVECTRDLCLFGRCVNEADDRLCIDGEFCNGEEYCDPAVGCSVGVPEPDLKGCDDGDNLCTLRDVCLDGSCFGVPRCHPVCQRCAPDGSGGARCEDLCANPHDPDLSPVNLTDSLFMLRASVGLEACAPCLCDVNDSGTTTATDSLKVLLEVVGLDGVLTCPVAVR